MVETNSLEPASHRVGRACSSIIATFGILATFALCVGCSGGDGTARNRVSGTVTLDGQPIPNGMITFEPDFNKGHTGPQGIARIRDGRFDTNTEGGRGIIGGPHRVRIEGYRGEVVDPESADPSESSSIEVLVDNYKTEVDLPMEDATHDFAITSDELQRPSGR
ncbi:hypothetical protein [Bremerella alba]|nr:hypothetical protein [Bremerella alba]